MMEIEERDGIRDALSAATGELVGAILVGSTAPGAQAVVACYDLNEGGGATVLDGSGNGNHGVILGAGYAPGIPELSSTTSGLTFTADDDRVEVPDAPSASS